MAAILTGYCLVAMVCGGATCSSRNRSVLSEFNPPPVFTEGTPTLDELIEKTNRSLNVNSLSSNSLTISSPELSQTLSGNFRWERPDNFRLETKLFTQALGTPLAAGSNTNMFWMQVSRPTPTIFYARHNEFENQSGGRHVLPVSPLWLREAFGIVELDPQGRHEGPTVRADGKLEVASYIPSPRGAYRRTLTMAPTTGTVEETKLYDHTGKLIAIATMGKHQYYSAINWSLPHQVQIQLLPDFGDPISFAVDVAFYQTNDQAPPNSFVFPDTTGLVTRDLVRLNESIQQDTLGLTTIPSNAANQFNNNAAQSGTNPLVPAVMNAPFPTPPATEPTQWQVQPHATPAGSPNLSAQNPSGVTTPIYRTSSQPTMSSWQDNLRR